MAGLISVITVNLDDASGLRATAHSVAMQERPPDEWIVIDGGSIDDSIAVISGVRAYDPFLEQRAGPGRL